MISGLFSLPLVSADGTGGALNGGAETFVAGPENALVRTLASAAVAEELPFNPLVLCGPLGVGKTSLAHSLAAQRRTRRGLKQMIATTGADLARGLAHAIETDSVADFRARHHRCDILLVDDLQRLIAKPAAQQFFLAALEALLKRGSLVIVTLRQPPNLTVGLLPMIASRLTGGLVVPLALPGSLARRELVRQAAERVSQTLDEQVVELLSAAVRLGTAARLRHAVFELSIAADMQRRAIRPAHAAKWLAQQSPEAKTVCRQVSTAVCKHSGLTIGELRSKTRQQAVSDARGLAMYLVRELTGASYAQIGSEFGGRDHTTVLHACRKFGNLAKRDDGVRRLAEELTAQLVAESAD